MRLQDEIAKDKVMKALADEYSRAILLSTIDKSKSAIEVSAERNVPISTAYRRLHDLEEAGLVVVERSVVSSDGKRYELYRSTVRSVAVSFNPGAIDVEIVPNEDMAAKFARLWGYIRNPS